MRQKEVSNDEVSQKARWEQDPVYSLILGWDIDKGKEIGDIGEAPIPDYQCGVDVPGGIFVHRVSKDALLHLLWPWARVLPNVAFNPARDFGSRNVLESNLWQT